MSQFLCYYHPFRLHVNIFDTANEQFRVPDSVVSRPPPPSSSHVESADLVFNFTPSPFEFWITRRSEAGGVPLFDTRKSSLPRTPIAPVNATDNSTALDGFGLVFEDQYGSHPIYMEHRFNESTNSSQSHGVFLMSSAGMDVLLLTPPESDVSLVQYRMIGGVMDLYFFSGPNPTSVVQQYGELIGLPTWQPYWGFGFHLCRWGYSNVSETREQVLRMREANIPLEVMWNDIDLYHALRDFTTDPVSFPAEDMRSFIRELASNNQHYIPIVDAAVAKQRNSSDIYNPYIQGAEQKVFITNPDGSEYIGQVWPGYTVFPDWFASNTQSWWTEALQNWSSSGVEFSGIWLDMNEASSFCDGSCGSGIDIGNVPVPTTSLPGQPGNLVTEYPEGYNVSISGPSGNITVNGTLTYGAVNLNVPPYAIHNGFGRLSIHTLATNATHTPGYAELDTHNMWGLMEERTTHLALQNIMTGKRPFLISRSTFPSSGKWSGHWLGDNYSKWQYMYFNIQGILQFQLFQIPMVGADTCGFQDNTDEELCNRWMQLSAFAPFYRNHNTLSALSQEPYRWDSVANASRTAIAIRYALLPYWYTLFINASTQGTPPVRALFWEFPDEPELFGVDRQFMVGRDILVTPVLTPNVSSVDGIFPGRGRVSWRDWYTHDTVNASIGTNTTLSAPLGHINVHVRDGSVLLLHGMPAYTTKETRAGPFALLASLPESKEAFGTAYVDDGESFPPGPNTTLVFHANLGQLTAKSEGTFEISQKLEQVTVLGVKKPSLVALEGKNIASWEFFESQEKLVVSNLTIDLNKPMNLTWM
ncbi:glycosyl hydrolases family 31-domain-containing protein [Phellopilus nigrolimitatus]|nr:glycosyl hydrolases family 31-domain-containing protein [Phellopilus nigrolimitatus]